MPTKAATETTEVESEYVSDYKKDYTEDWDVHRNYIQTFDPYEAMLVGQVYDSVSKSIDSSKITDSYAATLAIERAARVMGKLPDGNTEAVAKADQGKAAFMDILRQKWIYPNANSQHRFQTKLRLWQLYSSVYGYMPMFYDWNISATGYIGPDCWLWNPRNLIPQQGRTSINDMDRVTALTWVGYKMIEGLLEKDDDELKEAGWVRGALEQLKEKAKNETTDQDTEKDTEVSRARVSQATKRGICLATRYESGPDGKWCTFAPDHGFLQVRELDNPHKNGRIPFVIKYSQPLFDSFYGLGDFQRAKPLQFARDGLTNFYFAGIKNGLVPPLVVNANGVVKHTLDYRAGGIIMETIPNSVRTLDTSTAGLSTYQAAQSSLTGSLLSLYGSQNASMPGAETLNPSQGKTPAAIDLYNDKEATRDGQERMYLEEAIEELTDGFFSLVANIGTEEIPVNLFSADIEEIVKEGYADVLGIFQGNLQPNSSLTGGVLKVDPAKLRGIEYRFNINNGSTTKENKEAMLAGLERLMGSIGKFQNLFKDDQRIEVNWASIMSQYQQLSGVKGASDFITIKDAPSPTEQKLMEENQALQQQMQQMQQQAQEQATAAAAQPQATVNHTGMYTDPEIGQAAGELGKL